MKLLIALTALVAVGSSCLAHDYCLVKPKLAMLLDETLIADLKLTNQQRQHLADLHQRHRSRMVQHHWVKLDHDFVHVMDEEVNLILQNHQKQRLKEIWLQQNGWVALLDARVAEEVQLTKKQQHQLQQLADTMCQHLHTQRQHSSGDVGKLRDSYLAVHDAASRAIKQSLKEMQQQKFARMQGEQYEVIRQLSQNEHASAPLSKSHAEAGTTRQ